MVWNLETDRSSICEQCFKVWRRNGAHVRHSVVKTFLKVWHLGSLCRTNLKKNAANNKNSTQSKSGKHFFRFVRHRAAARARNNFLRFPPPTGNGSAIFRLRGEKAPPPSPKLFLAGANDRGPPQTAPRRKARPVLAVVVP